LASRFDIFLFYPAFGKIGDLIGERFQFGCNRADTL